MNEEPSQSKAGPLDGIRVLDLTRVLAGPFCTMILADLGAEVVKIERPKIGDDARQFGPFLPSGSSAYFASLNRGKQSVALDLKCEPDRQTFLRLLERADVLVENFRPGTMDAFGLSHDVLNERNPRLVHIAVSGFGREGAAAGRAAYDIIIQAASGLMSITGHDADHPVRVGTSISDILSGLFAAIGTLAALRDRDRHNVGAELDLAMLDCSVAALENAISRYEVTGTNPVPLGTRHPSITPFQAFNTADGAIVVAAGNDTLWRKMCDVLDCPQLRDDARFASNQGRTDHHAFLESALQPYFRRHETTELIARLDDAGVPSAPIRNIAEVVSDPDLIERGMLHEMCDEDGSTFVTAGSPFRFNGTSPDLSDHAPTLGEHNTDVLKRWLDEEE